MGATSITTAVATHLSATALTSTTFVIAYSDGSDGGKGKFWIGSECNDGYTTTTGTIPPYVYGRRRYSYGYCYGQGGSYTFSCSATASCDTYRICPCGT